MKEDIKVLREEIELLEQAEKEARKAIQEAEGRKYHLKQEFCLKYSKYKVGQRVKMNESTNVGRSMNPIWENKIVETEVESVWVFFKRENEASFYYNILKVKKNGETSSHHFDRGVAEEDIDEWNNN